jgi:hypothetical protein
MVSFTHLPLYPKEESYDALWLGGRVSPRAGLNDVEKRKSLGP